MYITLNSSKVILLLGTTTNRNILINKSKRCKEFTYKVKYF